MLMDRDAWDVPARAADVVSFSRTGLAVQVLHAHDVDLSGFGDDDVIPPERVHIQVTVGNGAPESPAASGVIDVPSGVLTVGDAEHEDIVEIGPGRWAVLVECVPFENAEKVHVWLQAV